ncbi:hypothetical protein [Haloimpatiens lingqiaonensis]|uniref:hypothetical protein n=1 Tax=Haloimpatiens lingqiaonensis TaxID=1380675 RepID=UPI0010FDD5A1|nr:hypothetical protein [Haloimpatiens lingqiaonensis]
MKKEDLKEFLENLKLFFQGATDFNRKSRGILQKEASEEMDNFILLCFSDLLGVPLSINYYTLELLPYIAEDMENWQRRMNDRKSIWAEKWADYDLDA